MRIVNSILILFLLVTFTINSCMGQQGKITRSLDGFKYSYFLDQEKINQKTLLSILNNDPDIGTMYQSGKSKTIIGGITLATGAGLVTLVMLTYTSNNSYGSAYGILGLIGIMSIPSGIALMIAGGKLKNDAINLYNTKIENNNVALLLGQTSNGIGLILKF